jgi:putative tricarboxylic transport membrane protein
VIDVFNGLATGFDVALAPQNIVLVLLGCTAGTLIGAMPGIGPINGVAILLPIAYGLGLAPESAIILLAGIYYGAEYGGRISSILLNVPGDAAAVMSTLDGHPLAKRGEAGRALSLSAVASFAGGTFAVVALSFLAPAIASLAVGFSPADYVALIVFAFASLSSMVGDSAIKTMLAAVFGLMIASVGIDAHTGVARFTFGVPDLLAGIDFLVIVIGLFGMAELFTLVERQFASRVEKIPLGRSFMSLADLAKVKYTILRSAVIGFAIGVLPGTGATIASAVTYGVEKRLAGDDGDSFGTGNLKGLAAPETANNAAAGGAMVPMLTLGVPGSGTTAILLGALLLFQITPGPMLFVDKPEVAWGLIASMYLGNVALLVINLPLSGMFAKILNIPLHYLTPLIACLAFIGVYSVVGNRFDLYAVIVLGLIGWTLRKLNFSLTPVVLGVVLGNLFEDNLRRSLSMSGGEWGILLESPVSTLLYALAAGIVVGPLLWSRYRRGPQNRRSAI